MYDNNKLILDSSDAPEPGQFIWRSPSNIAIIKYWGKYGEQMPQNPSLSFTLSASCTDTEVGYAFREEAGQEISLEFLFHEEENEAFRAKLVKYLTRLLPVFPFLSQLDLTVRSGNSFPHSAGIASSASAMSALALGLCSLEDKLFGTLSDPDAFDKKASYIARLGSGSACRSIYPHAAVWGESSWKGSVNEFAIGVGEDLHEVFKGMHDDIMIVSTDEKAISSRDGHALMEGNPFAEARYTQARSRLGYLRDALSAGDLEAFGKICEDEAMTLHALMMCSNPSYTLLRPDSLAIIEKVRAYREDTKQPVYFTLDAGPNVHLLYPENIIHDVRAFIESELKQHCEEEWYIQDWVGEGPEEI